MNYKSVTIDVLGLPRPKTRLKMVSTKHQEKVASHMIEYEGRFVDTKNLALLAWFYGADPRSDSVDLWNLLADAATDSGILKRKNIVFGSFEKRRVEDESNPFEGEPSTKLRIGEWD